MSGPLFIEKIDFFRIIIQYHRTHKMSDLPIEVLIKDPKCNCDPELQKNALAKNHWLIQYFQASREQWLAAIKQEPKLLLVSPYVGDQEFYLAAFAICPELILEIANPTHEQCLAVVKIKPALVSQLVAPDDIIWMAALERDGSLLPSCDYNGNKFKILTQIAINTNPSNVKYLTYVDEAVAFTVVSKDISLVRYLPSRVEAYVMRSIVAIYPHAIKYLPVQDIELQKIALTNNPDVFQWCNPQFPDVVNMALQYDPKLIKFVRQQTIEQARIALDRGVPQRDIIPSILEKIAEEKQIKEAEQAKKVKKTEQKALETHLLALTRQQSFQLTPAQTQLLSQVLKSDLDATTKQETIKLLFSSK